MPVHYIAQTQNICTRNHESRFSSTPEMWVALVGVFVDDPCYEDKAFQRQSRTSGRHQQKCPQNNCVQVTRTLSLLENQVAKKDILSTLQ